MACGILVPWPGIEPVPLAVKVQSLYWSTREVTSLSWLVKGICPAGEIAYVPLLVSSITKSVPGELRSHYDLNQEIIIKRTIQRHSTSICLLWGAREKMWRREWQSTPVFLPGESHGWRSLVDYSSWGRYSLRVGHDWATSLSRFTFMLWKRKWQPTPVFLPGDSQGWGSLVGCRLCGRTELDMTEAT